MGVIKFFSSSSYDGGRTPQNGWNAQSNPNPDPKNWDIIKWSEIGDYLVIKIKYLDCINYEGNKIMVYKGTTHSELVSQKLIDPHFSENKKYKSPIARFQPTGEGWEMALKFVEMCSIKDNKK